ncbi:hypothetical protein N7488_002165 [Penicillium malachiteum]|nr:hypothetical protein N7488_002165 [Penicillium malachiteum]
MMSRGAEYFSGIEPVPSELVPSDALPQHEQNAQQPLDFQVSEQRHVDFVEHVHFHEQQVFPPQHFVAQFGSYLLWFSLAFPVHAARVFFQ